MGVALRLRPQLTRKWVSSALTVFLARSVAGHREGVRARSRNFAQRCVVFVGGRGQNFGSMTSRVPIFGPRAQIPLGRGSRAWPQHFFTKFGRIVRIDETDKWCEFRVRTVTGCRVVTFLGDFRAENFRAWSRPHPSIFYFEISHKASFRGRKEMCKVSEA